MTWLRRRWISSRQPSAEQRALIVADRAPRRVLPDEEEAARAELLVGPLGLEAITEVIDRREQSVLVAASGNRSTDRQFYPGAFDTDPAADPDRDAVIGVGALDVIEDGDDPQDGMWVSPSRTGVLADFSNYGTWVDAWAPGVGLPVRHIIGLRFLLKDPLPMAGRGLVDGTSFATPYVAALIAEEIARSGDSPLDAWLTIEASGVPCEVGGENVGTAVALTSMGDTATTPQTEEGTCEVS
jgi:subtilisin family serine protease